MTRRKLSDLRLMAPQLRIEQASINRRQTLIISDARYVTGRAVLFVVSPDDIFDAEGSYFDNDLDTIGFIDSEAEIQSLPFDAPGVSKAEPRKPMIHCLDVDCSDCGAKAGKPCVRSMGPHQARVKARDDARAKQEA